MAAVTFHLIEKDAEGWDTVYCDDPKRQAYNYIWQSTNHLHRHYRLECHPGNVYRVFVDGCAPMQYKPNLVN